jgi:putative transposase
MRRQLGPIFHELARHKACRLIEGHVMPDHVPIGIEVPPKHAVASVMGLLKGKSAMAIARQCGGHERNVSGEHLWARGSAVSTVGFALAQVKASIRDQNTSDDDGRFEAVCVGRWHPAAFEAARLIKPPARRGVSDFANWPLCHFTHRFAELEPSVCSKFVTQSTNM